MSKYEKQTVGDLKKKLANYKLVQSGEKGILISRLLNHDKAVEYELKSGEVFITQLKMADLKKEAAHEGVSPIGNQDEILTSLIEKLVMKAKSNGNNNKKGSIDDLDEDEGDSKGGRKAKQSSGKQNDSQNVIALAQRVLALGERDDDEAIMNLGQVEGSEKITKATPTAVMRKAYLKLSLLLHPDKLASKFEQATKVFQYLVKAFERLSSPDLISEDKGRGKGGNDKNVKTISRSNENCHRTRVCCPKCKQTWSEGTLDGNPPYFYNFLMQGLKQFSCSTCLMSFGCMTAIHKCPHCKKAFEYSPSDYHRDRVLTDLKNELKLAQEKAIKEREAKVRRAARSSASEGFDENLAFIFNLSDVCPRCGIQLEVLEAGDQRRHLSECNDEKKHQSYKKEKEKAALKNEEKERKKELQESVEREAAFNFLGAKSSHLWLLDDKQVEKQAKLLNVEISGKEDKDELIAKIAREKKNREGGTLLLHDDEDGNQKNHKANKISHSDLPSNLHSMSFSQLKTVCASNGIIIPSTITIKNKLLDFIENGFVFEQEEKDLLLIKDGKMKIEEEEEEEEEGDEWKGEDEDDEEEEVIRKPKKRKAVEEVVKVEVVKKKRKIIYDDDDDDDDDE